MKIYTLTNTQQLPISRQAAWEFISNPAHLENITSDNMSFKPLDPLPETMYEGMVIRYQIKPLLGIPMHWVTEITHIDNSNMFIDEQRFGPFRFWHHEHRLIEATNGTELRDIIHYGMPFSIFGRIAHRMFIRRMLVSIFDDRKDRLHAIFTE